ncbi:MAG: hypothetical protein AAGG44_02110 [Planctomycetota bacterium]
MARFPEKYLQAFDQLPVLRERVASVLEALPPEILEDFDSDPTFEIVVEQRVPGGGSKMFMSLPPTAQDVSRCVVLRQKLEHAPEKFALYVIAHEFAHAFLRNGGWGEITDKEDAADALAATWGYAKPKLRWF